eukprot:141508-Chlamydomonas_euryale.AAC.2
MPPLEPQFSRRGNMTHSRSRVRCSAPWLRSAAARAAHLLAHRAARHAPRPTPFASSHVSHGRLHSHCTSAHLTRHMACPPAVLLLPTAPIESLPTAHIDSLPNAPIDSLPTAPIDSLPNAPIDSLPTAPSTLS